MKREVRILLAKATDSALLSVEYFNRPWERGRHEAVLIMLDRAFELLLKSVILHKGSRIREARANETIGFDTCVRKCVSDAQVKCLTKEEAITIQIINSLRDAAQHYIVDVSEQQLYLYTQAGLSLFDKMLRDVFDQQLSNYLPERALPVSPNPPKDFSSLMDIEFEDIKKLVKPTSRKKFQARAKLRSLAIIEASLSGSRTQPGENELGKLVRRVKRARSWRNIFPGIKRLSLNVDGEGSLNVSLRISKSKGKPIQLVPEGTPGATVVAVKRVDELGYYSLNLTALSEKVGLSGPRLLAVVKHLKLQEDTEFFKEFRIGSVKFKRYSSKALDKIKNMLSGLDLEKIWQRYRPSGKRSQS